VLQKKLPETDELLIPVTLPTHEGEIKRIKVQGQPRKEASKTPSLTIHWTWWFMLVNPSYGGGPSYKDCSLKKAMGRNKTPYLKSN
jgi:hypothetical protein